VDHLLLSLKRKAPAKGQSHRRKAKMKVQTQGHFYQAKELMI